MARKELKRTGMLSVGLPGLLLMMLLPAGADASSQSFYALNNSAKQGMLVSLSANPGVVEPASNQNAKSLVGVVAPADDASFDQQAGQISVRTDGVATALVSTLGGNIIVGDRIGPSSLVGIGSKVTGSGWIAGTAQASLDASTANAIKATIADNKGVKHTVYLASIPLLVKVTYYNSATASPTTWVPHSLQSAADALAHKQVSATALILSTILLLVGVAMSGMVINSAIRGGMMAISRQPLAKALITRKVLQSFGLSVVILTVVIVGAVVLLRIL